MSQFIFIGYDVSYEIETDIINTQNNQLMYDIIHQTLHNKTTRDKIKNVQGLNSAHANPLMYDTEIAKTRHSVYTSS